jgi:hypothetical protein
MNSIGRGISAVLIFGVIILFASTAFAQRDGTPVGGLQVTLSQQPEVTQSEALKFRVSLGNVSNSNITLNLGIFLGNGPQYPTALNLIVTDEQGRVRRLVIGGPPLAGRVYPWVLHLAGGATFNIPIDFVDSTFSIPIVGLLENYPLYPIYKLSPGTYSIQALFIVIRDTQGPLLDIPGISTRYWEGTATSNQLRFEVPGQ